MNIAERAKAYAILKEQKEAYEHKITLINAELEELGREIFGGFAESGMKSFRLDGAGLFKDGQDRILYPELKFRGTIADQDKFYRILRESGNGALIKETVHHATLESWIREQKENNKPLPEDSVLKVWTVEGAKVRRAGGRKGTVENE